MGPKSGGFRVVATKKSLHLEEKEPKDPPGALLQDASCAKIE